MTSQFSQQEFPFANFANGNFPSPSTATAHVQNSFPIFNTAEVNRHQRTNGHTMKRNLAASGFEDGEPKAKRRVERMNAHFKNFHISPEKNPNHEMWQSRQGQETFQEIEDRLSDSSEEEMLEDNEEDNVSLEEVGKKVHLSEVLKEYINTAREKPIIIPSISDKALVPYIPRNPLDDPTMRGRIKEISEEEACMIPSSSSSHGVPYVEYLIDDDKDHVSACSNDSLSSVSFTELPDDSEFDMDVDFE
uniref:Uncharacterized protein n=1 Tax=Syphacia muris TaxID=451379 RepID=A0A0N5ANE4_9BILA